jgi:F-type H+-transporting ATPase subunit b
LEIFEQFGVDHIVLTAQIFNFLIILYLLKRFLYKPVFKALSERRDAIKESMMQAEETRKLLDKAEEREKSILKKAQDESKKLLEETRKQQTQIIAEAEASAKNQAQKILTEAKRQIEQDSKEAQRALSLQITELAEVVLRKSVSQMFGEEEQQKIIKKAVEQIKKKRAD